MASKKKSGFLFRFKAEAIGGELIIPIDHREAVEREISEVCEEGEVVKVLIFRIGPNVGPWTKVGE